MNYKDKKITGKQVNLILAKCGEAGIRGDLKILEFIEFECGIDVDKIENLTVFQLEQVLLELKDKHGIM